MPSVSPGALLEGAAMLSPSVGLEDCEGRLDVALRQVDFIGDVPLDEWDVALLGTFLSRVLAAGGLTALKRRVPASLVSFLVWVGILDYRGGEYWPAVERRLPGFRIADGDALGHAFLSLLPRFGLASFPACPGAFRLHCMALPSILADPLPPCQATSGGATGNR